MGWDPDADWSPLIIPNVAVEGDSRPDFPTKGAFYLTQQDLDLRFVVPKSMVWHRSTAPAKGVGTIVIPKQVAKTTCGLDVLERIKAIKEAKK